MTTQPQTNADGDSYEPVVQLGQGDYTYDWPAPPATIDVELDERPGSSDGSTLGLAVTLGAYFAAGLIIGCVLGAKLF